VEAETSCGGCGSEEHGTGRRREVGEMELEEGRSVLRWSGFILFRRTLVGALAAATGAAAAATTTVTAKTTRGEPITRLLEDVQEGGGPLSLPSATRTPETEREGASGWRGGGSGGEIYPMEGRKK